MSALSDPYFIANWLRVLAFIRWREARTEAQQRALMHANAIIAKKMIRPTEARTVSHETIFLPTVDDALPTRVA